MSLQSQDAPPSTSTCRISENLKDAPSFQATTPANKSPRQEALTVIKQFRVRSGMKAMMAIFSNYFVFTLCVVSVESVSKIAQMPSYMPTVLYVLSVLIIASRMRALENLVHEASHNSLFKSEVLHQQFQFLYAFPIFRQLEDYRRSHILHHKHLGNPEKDPDIVRLYSLGLGDLPKRPLWFLFGLPMTGFLTYEFFTTTFVEFWTSPSSRRSKLLFWATAGLGVVYSNTLPQFGYYFMIPFCLVLPVTRYWAEISEHIGLDMRETFGDSRTNIGFVHRWYMNPHNDGYHGVHHLCSQIPFHMLPNAHRSLIKCSPEFEATSVISNGITETFRQLAARETVVKG